ncbi:hypothetical protein MLD38_018608 [Melastoma candidum]|uniref:Uncharacterized protein n=1 Tax=Melastoma candidum TaxID=119954 RepID=A0ACB9QVF2_9MYRT|nr:hypothetical protein MLD38_018608 [Melastoma candidum]
MLQQGSVTYIAVALAIVLITCWLYRWRNPKVTGVLPPGSMGLPLVGEVLSLLLPSNSLDLHPFLKTRLQRYGRLFRTRILNKSVVVVADARSCHLILKKGEDVCESWSLDTFAKIFQQNKVNMGDVHKYMRSSVLKQFGMEALAGKLISMLEEASRAALEHWEEQDSIEVKLASARMAIEFSTKQLFSGDRSQSEKLGSSFFMILRGFMSVPINLPGTTHHKCLKEHEKAISLIRGILGDRFSTSDTSPDDLLSRMIRDRENYEFLTEDFVVKLLFGLIYVSVDSVAVILTLALKFLAENPKALKELNDEHEAILKQREDSSTPLTWKEYKSMTFTLQVINETLRLANVSPGLFRRARKDIEINGYTIPSGWVVLIATSALHLDPETYENPTEFNPWRWKEPSRAMVENFMPFGSGWKQCAGAEYTRVFLSTFLHVLVTNYKWKRVMGGEVCRTPIINFGKGLHIEVAKGRV